MKKKLVILGMYIGILCMLCACSIRSDKKISEEKIDARREMFEEYLAQKYPDETFTVKVWQEYVEETGVGKLVVYNKWEVLIVNHYIHTCAMLIC